MDEGNDTRGPRARCHEAVWQDFAACAETDPDAFFPGDGESPRPAKRVCAGCFVRQECLGYALANPSLLGVWGGTTYAERRELRRGSANERRRAAQKELAARRLEAILAAGEKRCPKCEETKPLSEFGRSRAGFQSWCRGCVRRAQRGAAA